MTKDELLKIVNEYYEKYQLPELKVSDNEWDALLSVLERYLPNNLKDAINILLRRAFNTALCNNGDYFTLYYIIVSLKDLEVFNLREEDINNIKNEIMLESLKNGIKRERDMTK